MQNTVMPDPAGVGLYLDNKG